MSLLWDDINWKEKFKNHVARMDFYTNDLRILSFKEPGRKTYEMEFILYNCELFITGDLGWASFGLTWDSTLLPEWVGISPSYLASKCKSISEGIYVWSNEEAIKDIKKSYRNILEESEYFDINIYDEVFDAVYESTRYNNSFITAEDDDVFYDYSDVKEILTQMWIDLRAARMSENEDGFYCYLREAEYFDDDFHFSNDLYEVGERLNPRFEVWLIALRMATSQLTNGRYRSNEQNFVIKSKGE